MCVCVYLVCLYIIGDNGVHGPLYYTTFILIDNAHEPEDIKGRRTSISNNRNIASIICIRVLLTYVPEEGQVGYFVPFLAFKNEYNSSIQVKYRYYIDYI